ncbi:hypothetical protein TWF694_006198 [Orbilia ellipsospora]|uniref:Uncharacterized protein n=1 Tax=Orbilia ellipsospora TaxID=2528407 RepID=A0AAV9XKC2_9PEZI
MFLTGLVAAFLLGITAVASPVPLDSCPAPTVLSSTVYLPTPTTSTGLTYLAISQNVTTLGVPTSTDHISWVQTFYKTKTITTLTKNPTLTVSTTVIAPGYTFIYGTSTIDTTLPGSPPTTDPCAVITCYQTSSPGTLTYTYSSLYTFEYSTITEHVTTSTRTVSKTVTSTVTTARPSRALTTITVTVTSTPIVLVAETEWHTFYATPGPCT